MDYNQILRLNVIVDRLSSIAHPTLEDLMRALENHSEIEMVGERTLRRDLKVLREKFGFDYEYDPYSKRYRIPQEFKVRTKQLSEFFSKLDAAYLYKSLQIDPEKAQSFISADIVNWETGFRHVPMIVKAITTKRAIHFESTNYDTLETKARTLRPYFLKEYARTWYVYGTMPEKEPEFTIFGLDRVKNLCISMDSFSPIDANISTLFDELIGVNLKKNKPVQRVRLRVMGRVGQIMKNKPIHHSQTSEDIEGGVEIELHVRPNIALEQEILKHGEEVLVLEPPSLVESLRERINKMSDQYRE